MPSNCQEEESVEDTALTTRRHVGPRGHFPTARERKNPSRIKERREGSRRKKESEREREKKRGKRNEPYEVSFVGASVGMQNGRCRVRGERQNSRSVQHTLPTLLLEFLQFPSLLTCKPLLSSNNHHNSVESFNSLEKRPIRIFGKEAVGVSPGDPIPPSDTILSDEN